MDFATMIGIIAGIAFIIIGILINGKISDFYDFASIMIVLGGTFAATLITYPLKNVIGIVMVVRNAFASKSDNYNELINNITKLADVARKEGLLALEEAAYEIKDDFLQRGVLMVIDGTDSELIKNILETEVTFLEDRHRIGQGILETMGSYAPAFGMVGTLIGLINMLASLSDPDKIGPSMAVALVTTFYGIVLANLIFLPLAGKLKNKTARERLYKEMIIEGILSVQAGENPRMIKEKLLVFLPPEQRFAKSEKQRGTDSDEG